MIGNQSWYCQSGGLAEWVANRECICSYFQEKGRRERERLVNRPPLLHARQFHPYTFLTPTELSSSPAFSSSSSATTTSTLRKSEHLDRKLGRRLFLHQRRTIPSSLYPSCYSSLLTGTKRYRDAGTILCIGQRSIVRSMNGKKETCFCPVLCFARNGPRLRRAPIVSCNTS